MIRPSLLILAALLALAGPALAAPVPEHRDRRTLEELEAAGHTRKEKAS